MDNDDAALFERTVEFLLNNEVNFMRINIFTPYPGTEFYKRLESERRIFETDWSKYDLNHVVSNPQKMSIQDLTDSVWSGFDVFYSFKNIFKRLWKFKQFYLSLNNKCSFLDDLLFQLHFHNATRKRLDPWSGII